jgi:hypothetical protein
MKSYCSYHQFSPSLSWLKRRKLKRKLELKHANVIQMEPSSNRIHGLGSSNFINWSWLSIQLNQSGTQIANTKSRKNFREFKSLKIKNTAVETSLAVVRDTKKIQLLAWVVNSCTRVFCQKYIGTKTQKWYTLMPQDYQNHQKEWYIKYGH